MAFEDSPHGFEDGEIVSYRMTSEALSVEYRFWNASVAILQFVDPVAMRDDGAVGATIGSVDLTRSSELIADMVRRVYVTPPESPPWRHFRFLNVDDEPVLQVIAHDFRFVADGD